MRSKSSTLAVKAISPTELIRLPDDSNKENVVLRLADNKQKGSLTENAVSKNVDPVLKESGPLYEHPLAERTQVSETLGGSCFKTT